MKTLRSEQAQRTTNYQVMDMIESNNLFMVIVNVMFDVARSARRVRRCKQDLKHVDRALKHLLKN